MSETIAGSEELRSAAPSDHRIGLMTLSRYLIGRRDAILVLASNRSTLWVGFLFVLSAGFAREYDGEDLLAEPWHLLIPLAASLASSLVLFLLVLWAARQHKMQEGSAGRLYLQFLGLYWMTAPLAWVYAVPFERFLSGPDSVRANLLLLGLVAVWRVVLIIRVIVVLYGAKPVAGAMLVLAFGDVLVFFLMQTVDVPLLQIMGGVRLDESQQIIAGVATSLIVLSVVSAPVWLIGALVVLFGKGDDWLLAIEPASTSVGISRGLGLLAGASLAVWSAVLPITQPEQQLRTRVDRMVEQGQLDEALTLLAAAGPDAFPPHWTPPPRVSRRGLDVPLLVDLQTRQEATGSPAWLRDVYRDKLGRALRNHFSLHQYWGSASTTERQALVDLLERQTRDQLIAIFGPDLDELHVWSRDDASPTDKRLEERLMALFKDDSAEQADPPKEPDVADEEGSNLGGR